MKIAPTMIIATMPISASSVAFGSWLRTQIMDGGAPSSELVSGGGVAAQSEDAPTAVTSVPYVEHGLALFAVATVKALLRTHEIPPYDAPAGYSGSLMKVSDHLLEPERVIRDDGTISRAEPLVLRVPGDPARQDLRSRMPLPRPGSAPCSS